MIMYVQDVDFCTFDFGDLFNNQTTINFTVYCPQNFKDKDIIIQFKNNMLVRDN